jgi:predicted RNase H-like nuclease (RuvC/YqgF family)
MKDLTLSVVSGKQSTSGTAIDSTALLQARSSKSKKRSDEEFDSMFKERLDLTGENELLKHSHAALERTLESMQRDLDTANEWRLEAIEELDEVTDELTLLKETLHAQGLRLPN